MGNENISVGYKKSVKAPPIAEFAVAGSVKSYPQKKIRYPCVKFFFFFWLGEVDMAGGL
jgi:hypothetical protein